MEFTKRYIGAIGVVVGMIGFFIYYSFIYMSSKSGESCPIWAYNIQLYSMLLCFTLTSLHLALGEKSKVVRLLIYWTSVEFWGGLTLLYLVDDLSVEGSYIDGLVHTNKIIITLIIVSILCLFVFCYRWLRSQI